MRLGNEDEAVRASPLRRHGGRADHSSDKAKRKRRELNSLADTQLDGLLHGNCEPSSHLDEFALRVSGRTALESDQESQLQSAREAPECFDRRLMLAAFDTTNRRVARAHPLGQLALAEAKLTAPHDHDAGDGLERLNPRCLFAIGGATRGPTGGASRRAVADGA